MKRMEDAVTAYREAAGELILAEESLKAAGKAFHEAEKRVHAARVASTKAGETVLELHREQSA